MTVYQVFEFDVDGLPIAQGSMSAFPIPGTNRAVVTDQKAKTLKPWRNQVTAIARDAYAGEQLEGAVAVLIEFRLLRGKTVRRDRPFVKPDLDKLARSIFDALTASGVIKDDAQITKASLEKVYGDPGVHVRVGQFKQHPTPEGDSK